MSNVWLDLDSDGLVSLNLFAFGCSCSPPPRTGAQVRTHRRCGLRRRVRLVACTFLSPLVAWLLVTLHGKPHKFGKRSLLALATPDV